MTMEIQFHNTLFLFMHKFNWFPLTGKHVSNACTKQLILIFIEFTEWNFKRTLLLNSYRNSIRVFRTCMNFPDTNHGMRWALHIFNRL